MCKMRGKTLVANSVHILAVYSESLCEVGTEIVLPKIIL
jgi:hypothetical protein